MTLQEILKSKGLDDKAVEDVIGINGVVTAAINIKNIQKA